MKIRILSAFVLFSLVFAGTLAADDHQIPNQLIDTPGFLRDVAEAQQLRLKHRVTEEEFIRMAREPGTIILDARNPDRFAQMHIAGAKHLDFTDFTAASLAAAISSKNARVLIYCNNNIQNSPVAFASKAPAAALNLSTFTSLYSYGYRNVYELGPVIDPAVSRIRFEGTLAR
jgi:rhodanese-related sulfurtransferase